ncbi:Short coiled-coil protein homolog [Caenorhabditis elegans]|uniref:Short coiled-coil protein homolog n=1 Tax=Caenorhabditis elegans TaxID=6239 RepID=A7LPF8_CAEEL|nr:Short coiled-coil protein homolog [Caenorhabditis elegans]CAO82069.1 Short coiled-coil protein homolog [Caenorhabditis elegans]|eukprot:NP_001122717.1 Uncharacterized protein CELE_T07A5.6 [Caenorhabditis elegans]
MSQKTEQDDIPLADDDDTVTIISGGKTPRAAQPLPKEEPPEDPEEKARMITQVLELQNTLDDLSQRVESVKEESLKLRSENQVLGQYIQNLMSSSSVFQSSQPSRPKHSRRRFWRVRILEIRPIVNRRCPYHSLSFVSRAQFAQQKFSYRVQPAYFIFFTFSVRFFITFLCLCEYI